MTWLPDIRKRILITLSHGPLNLVEFADELDVPQFRLRAELAELKRDRLIRQTFGYQERVWALTDRGQSAAVAAHDDQLSIWEGSA